MTYELLDHPADVKFRTRGETIEAAFAAVVPALAALVDGGSERDRGTVTRETTVEGRNLEALLFDFLDQLILFQDLDDAVVTAATGVEIDETEGGYRLSAVIHARPIPADEALLDVKAPTYSEMRVEESDGWTIEAVLDV